MTKLWRCGNTHQFDGYLNEAVAMLRVGGVVAFPTETVYGLGADARQTHAVEKIFAAKGRPLDNPLIVHIANRAQLEELAEPPDKNVTCLLDIFWPGPLTIILPVKPGILSPLVTAGLDTVALRMPDHAVALQLIEVSGCPLAGPSANSSGRPSPTLAEHVLEDLNGKIDGIMDCGPTEVGLESTVVQYITADRSFHILRPGAITEEQIRAALPGITVREESAQRSETPRSPGMKYAHYAPRGSMTIIQGDDKRRVIAVLQQELDRAQARGECTGVLTYEEHVKDLHADHAVACGSLANLESVARGLYAALRAFDEAGATFIVAEGCGEEGIGAAIMNRLRKAAGGRIVRV